MKNVLNEESWFFIDSARQCTIVIRLNKTFAIKERMNQRNSTQISLYYGFFVSKNQIDKHTEEFVTFDSILNF